MPIKIPDSLPARSVLEGENIFVMTEYRALHQDIRPLKVLILNLMPTKLDTEAQLLRKLSNTPLQIEIELLRTISHDPKNTSTKHLDSFYRSYDEIRDNRYDGMIITGAPVEKLEFEQVDYWTELCEIMEWTRSNVHSTLHICWGAQAGLYYHYGIQKYDLPRKLSGVFRHTVEKPNSPFFRGFNDVFYMPHSRYTEVRAEDIISSDKLELLSTSPEAGVFAVKSENNRRIFITGHPEYDDDTLAKEYFRDQEKGLDPDIPVNYFEENDPQKKPVVIWRSHAQLLYNNWLNYYVYQTTPYDLSGIDIS